MISPLVWAVSVVIGLMQSFVFAEIAGLFPRKSGGASVFGAMAWAPYSKFVAPISVWCNWLAWSPVLSIGSALAAGYTLTARRRPPLPHAGRRGRDGGDRPDPGQHVRLIAARRHHFAARGAQEDRARVTPTSASAASASRSAAFFGGVPSPSWTASSAAVAVRRS